MKEYVHQHIPKIVLALGEMCFLHLGKCAFLFPKTEGRGQSEMGEKLREWSLPAREKGQGTEKGSWGVLEEAGVASTQGTVTTVGGGDLLTHTTKRLLQSQSISK